MVMSKTILVPIDFRIESLNTLRFALEDNRHEKLNIILMYSEYQDNSITQMLFYSSEQRISKLSTQEFKDTLGIIRNMYETSINSLRIELFHGLNSNAFKNFHIANKIDLIVLPKNLSLQPHKNGFDPIPLIKSSKLEYTEIGWDFSDDLSRQLYYNIQ